MTRVVTYLFIRGRTPKLACSVGTMSWDVGGVRITRVVELVMPFPIDFSAEATPSTSPPRRGSCPTSYVLHHPIQCRHSEWTARGDADPDAARATRRALLAAAATTNALMLGTHFTGTAAGRILSTDQGYHFAPQPHD